MNTKGFESRIISQRYVFAIAIAIACAFANAKAANPSADNLIINEVMPANIDMFVDASGDYGGFIELYNPTDESVRLLNMFVSDDRNDLYKFRLSASNGSVPAHGYKILWFDHNGTEGDYFSNASQVPWKLNLDGGDIFICNKDSQLVVSLHYPKNFARTSWSRKTDGGVEWGYTSQPTPGRSNVGVSYATSQVASPKPDADGCVFESDFTLHVSYPEGATLHYTTDGSTPTESSATTSSGTFRIKKNESKVYRFRCFREGYLPSEVITRSYIYRSRNYTLPVVSLVSANDNFYGDSLGILVKGLFTNYDMDWDRPVNFEMFGTDNTCIINTECDMAPSGAFSRSLTPRPFRLKASKLYSGRNTFDAQFFEMKNHVKTKNLKFRNGGNDVSNRIKDGALQEIIQRSGMYLDGQLYRPVHVLINGHYHGMLNIREPSNKFFAYSNYGIDTDLVDAFEYDPADGYVQKDGDNEMFMKFIALSENASDDAVYEEICKLVDIDEYCNYMAAQCWMGGNDWITNNNNAKGFRERSDDGRLHLVMYDIDAAFSMTDIFSLMKKKVSDSHYAGGANYLISSFLNLLENPRFAKLFATSYCLVAGSVFEPTRCEQIINEIRDLIKPALALENLDPTSKASEVLKDIKSSSRRAERMAAMSNYLQLDNGKSLEFCSNIPEARFLLNDCFVPTSRFSGTLYGEQTLEAFAPAGYNFVGWRRSNDSSVFSTDRRLTFTSLPAMKIVAEFEPVAEEELLNACAFPVVINEVSASNTIFCNEYFKRNDWVELYNNTDNEIDVKGMYLSDNEHDLHKYQINTSMGVSTVIPPHGHLIIWCDKLDPVFEVHATFKLANSDYERVFLTAADDSWTDSFQYVSHIGTHSVGRFPDGGRSVYEMTKPTIGHSNIYTTQSSLLYGDNENHIPGTTIGIEETSFDSAVDCQYYSVSGVLLPKAQKGLNIVRTPDGIIRRILVR